MAQIQVPSCSIFSSICRLAFLMYLKIGAEGECGEVQDDGEGGGDLCGDVW